jgi:hypothetical protein
MQVTLEAIKFNHDPTGETTGAFNLRRNETVTIPIPEWCIACADDPDLSAVAYAIDGLPDPITIKAIFSCRDHSLTSIWIKAIDGTVSDLPQDLRPVNILGEVQARQIVLKDGQSKYEVFNLKDPQLSKTGASASDNTWLWQYSLDSRDWIDIGTTTHRVYSVPGLPSSPWEPRSGELANIHLPWTEVLEYACHWAAGHEDLRQVATAVTTGVNGLGKLLVSYRPGPSYTDGKFNCSAFLDLLKRGVGIQTLNCDDCATIVSTFANILGCNLWQSGMGREFDTNRILPIGASYWRNFFFFHHSVAWEGNCVENNLLFDACFQIDTDGKPGSAPQKPVQPAKIHFGNSRDGGYVSSFAKDSTCRPIPKDASYGRQRRKFGKSRLGEAEIEDNVLLDLLKRVYNFDLWPKDEAATIATFAKGLAERFMHGAFFRDWRLDSWEESQNAHGTNIFRAILNRTDSMKSSELLSINLFECAPTKNSSDFLLQLLGRFEEILSRPLSTQIGSVVFVSTGEVVVLFKRGRFVVAILSAGRKSLSVVEIARAVDGYLQI